MKTRVPPNGPPVEIGLGHGSIVRQTQKVSGDKGLSALSATPFEIGETVMRPELVARLSERLNFFADFDLQFAATWEGDDPDYLVRSQIQVSINNGEWETVYETSHIYPRSPAGTGEDPPAVPYMVHVRLTGAELAPTGWATWPAGQASATVKSRVIVDQTSNPADGQQAYASYNEGSASLRVQSVLV